MATNATGGSSQKKSLQQRLEESRSNKFRKSVDVTMGEGQHSNSETATKAGMVEEVSDEEWEDDACSHDVTVDLNEPHSRSGKYWKTEFNKYSGDARAEMEKLVKYKHLAKCYAQKKDSEAAELNQKLKEEQEKVQELEETIAAMSLQPTKKRGRSSDSDDSALARKLAEKTALVKEYKDRVKELESLLAGQGHAGGKTASPGTEKTLLEANRELRRARNELKEMRRLQEENEQLKHDLASAEQRATKHRKEDKHAAVDSSQSSWAQKLENQLCDSREEAQRKDDELKRLRKEFETLKDNAKSSRSQALQVLKEKNDKISELEKELQKRQDSENSRSHSEGLDAALAKHKKITRGLKSDIASLNKPSIHDKAKLGLPKRSMSAEDLTLDYTQQSFLESPARKTNSRGFPAELTDTMKDIEEELRQERRARMEARRRDRDIEHDDIDIRPLTSLTNGHISKTSEAPSGSRRVMSDTVNGVFAKDQKQKAAITRATLGDNNKALMRGGLDNLTNSRYTSRFRTTRPPSPSLEMPAFDLLQNRFAKLGGPNPNDTVLTANASRCTLPADRQAAARARLEQKRRERQKVGDKENVRP